MKQAWRAPSLPETRSYCSPHPRLAPFEEASTNTLRAGLSRFYSFRLIRNGGFKTFDEFGDLNSTRTRTFSHIEHLARFDRLPPDFLCEEPISTHERSILSFLLHVWNHYDYPFDLSEVAGWSDQHQIAFSNWVSGHTLGTRCRYF